MWCVSLREKKTHRLVTGWGACSLPVFCPKGTHIAFTSNQGGAQEVYMVEHQGSLPKRLTFLGGRACVVGWDHRGILFISSHESPFSSQQFLYRFVVESGAIEKMPVGPCSFFSPGPNPHEGVLQRHGYGYINWKNYQGGTGGDLWIQRNRHTFEPLAAQHANALQPLWVGKRIYFLSDALGKGTLHSVDLQGKDPQHHPHPGLFYMGHIATDGARIVYSSGGDLGLYHVEKKHFEGISFSHVTTTPSRQHYFEEPSHTLSGYQLNASGDSLCLTTRGRLFAMPPQKGPVFSYGKCHGVRYRLGSFLWDGRLMAVCDEGREENIEVYSTQDALADPVVLPNAHWGRLLKALPSPCGPVVLLANHRNELFSFDVDSRVLQRLDHSPFGLIHDMAWSPDGCFAAYSIKINYKIAVLRLVCLETGEKTDLTPPLLNDFSPSFDPQGRYLYFLSARCFSPSWDPLVFDMGFSRGGVRPYAISLQKEGLAPSMALMMEGEKDEESFDKNDKNDKNSKKISIDLQDIQKRVVALPCLEGEYIRLHALKDKILLLVPDDSSHDDDEKEEALTDSEGVLKAFDLVSLSQEVWASGVESFCLSYDQKKLAYYDGKRLRVIKAHEKPDNESPASSKTWVDWHRVALEVKPSLEWRHMFQEAWRLQKELFWNPEKTLKNWDDVYRRYEPLLERIATYRELIDLIHEMQGELESSHAYVMPPPSKKGPGVPVGKLGCVFVFEPSLNAYRISQIYRGDFWHETKGGPLTKPGFNVQEGDLLWAISGRRLSRCVSPERLLLNQTQWVSLTVSGGDGQHKRTLWVQPVTSTQAMRYRDWVNNNRNFVHHKTNGKVGYIHIPDMSYEGFAEFHRAYLLEHHRQGLIVDVRFNGGGCVSSLILEKLSRKRLGFDQSRWDGLVPYPLESPAGPMVALANEYTGSDGDIFCYGFKKLGLGPLIGKRTWGGVVGIFPRHPLIDGTLTTQPEYSFWCHDIGWSIENHGVDPDILIDISPYDAVNDSDTQLLRAIEEAVRCIPLSTKSLPPTS